MTQKAKGYYIFASYLAIVIYITICVAIFALVLFIRQKKSNDEKILDNPQIPLDERPTNLVCNYYYVSQLLHRFQWKTINNEFLIIRNESENFFNSGVYVYQINVVNGTATKTVQSYTYIEANDFFEKDKILRFRVADLYAYGTQKSTIECQIYIPASLTDSTSLSMSVQRTDAQGTSTKIYTTDKVIEDCKDFVQ